MSLPFLRNLLRWLILAVVIGPLLATADRPMSPVHNFEGKCNECHLSVSGGKKIFVREIDRLCDGCHTSLGLSHPSGMRPSFAIPAGFPLDWNGRMTCATCHDAHGNREFLMRTEKRGRQFCFMCHETLPGIHGDSRQPAHTGSRRGPRGFEAARFEGSIDRISVDCLVCHDVTSARPADVRIGAGVYNHAGGGSHPIGVDYMKAFARGRYVHPSRMKPAIVLINGRIGCGTCHNIYSKEKFYLAVSNERSALCFQCHVK
jgi:predicted CXXCH cytochrome family protein